MIRTAIFVSIGAILATVAISVYGVQQIPVDTMIPSHWNIKGEVDDYAPRNFVLALFPAISVIVSAIFIAIPYIDPRRENVSRSAGLYYATLFGTLGLIVSLHFAIVVSIVNGTNLNARFVLTPVCVLLIFVGNYMAKSRSTWFIGLRTPWTLSSEAAWITANRTTGLLFVITGIAAIATSYLSDVTTGFGVMTVGVLASASIGVAVSYIVWRRDTARAE